MEKLFSEIYNRYFLIINLLLSKRGPISQKFIKDTVQKHGFGESLLFLLPRLSANEWELFEDVNGSFHSMIPNGISLPLSRLQKRWLKAVLRDPRAGLFLSTDNINILNEALKDVSPLFYQEDFYYYDRFSDGDDYSDTNYRMNFRMIQNAIFQKNPIRISYETRNERITKLTVLPHHLEYSVKNDCFRLLCDVLGQNRPQKHILRLSRIKSISIPKTSICSDHVHSPEKKPEKITLMITDKRNALERVMLQFADYQKNTVRLDDSNYRCEIFYDKDDETELLIEILSFGPVIRVIENDHFIELIKERLRKQALLSGSESG